MRSCTPRLRGCQSALALLQGGLQALLVLMLLQRKRLKSLLLPLLLLVLLLLLHQQVPLQELRLELLLSTGISMTLRLGQLQLLLLLLLGVSLHHLQGLHIASCAGEAPLATYLAAHLPWDAALHG